MFIQENSPMKPALNPISVAQFFNSNLSVLLNGPLEANYEEILRKTANRWLKEHAQRPPIRL